MTAPGRRIVAALFGALATMAGGLLYRGFFAGPGYLAPLLAATLVGLLFGLISGVRRWPVAGTVLAGCGIAALVTGYVAFAGRLTYGLPGPRMAAEVFWGVTGGWARMLSSGVPAEPSGELLVPPVLAHFGAAAGAAVLALRTRPALAPIGPPLAAYVVGLVLVGPAVANSVPATALFTAATAGLLAWGRRRTGPGSAPIGSLAVVTTAAVLVVAAVAATGLALGPVRLLVPGVDRADASRLLRPPVQITPVVDPLAAVRAQIRQDPPRQLFTLQVVAGAPALVGDRIRLVALDRFDGALWTTEARHLAAGRAVPAAVGPAGSSAPSGDDELRVRVTVDGLSGPFLPAIGQPRRVEARSAPASQLGLSESAGTLVTTAAEPTGLTYTVTSRIRARDAGFTTAVPIAALVNQELREVPGTPPEVLTALLRQLTDSRSRPVDKLRAIEEHLRSLPYDTAARPGHSYAAIERLLDPGPAGGGVGNAEQRASAFAVLARMLGYPARVVVGFRLPAASSGPYRITTRDAHAWPEMLFSGYGWVPFEPTDLSRPDPGRPAQPGTVPETPAATPSPVRAEPPPPPHAGGTDGGIGAGGPGAVPLLAVLALLVLLALLSIPLAKVTRRWWRRSRGTPTARITGAWAETVDRLRERRVPTYAGMTPHEIARAAVGPPDLPELTELAETVTATVFGVDQPDARAARAAWRLEGRIRRRLQGPPWSYRRYLAWCDPGPLLPDWRVTRSGPRHERAAT